MDNEMDKIYQQMRLYKLLTVMLLFAVAALIVWNVFMLNRPGSKEITVEKINVVEGNGKIRMVISNRGLQHPGIVGGKTVPQRDRPAGLIFFNDDGDECGGLVYTGDKKSADMVLSVDQYKNDQVMQLQYSQDYKDGKAIKSYGLRLWDRDDHFTLENLLTTVDSLKKLPDPKAYENGIEKLKSVGYLGQERLFVGRNKQGQVGLFLKDEKGLPRLRIYVNEQNKPVIESLDEQGKITAIQ